MREEKLAIVERHLKKTLEGMIREIFGDVQMRWVDAYFPFTDPSFELEIYFQVYIACVGNFVFLSADHKLFCGDLGGMDGSVGQRSYPATNFE